MILAKLRIRHLLVVVQQSPGSASDRRSLNWCAQRSHAVHRRHDQHDGDDDPADSEEEAIGLAGDRHPNDDRDVDDE
jgi:hypothetical protein